jgi:uncharacterized protein involved in tolerance to divalent cations
MNNARLVVINCADEAEAERIARSLVGERLAGAARESCDRAGLPALSSLA